MSENFWLPEDFNKALGATTPSGAKNIMGSAKNFFSQVNDVLTEIEKATGVKIRDQLSEAVKKMQEQNQGKAEQVQVANWDNPDFVLSLPRGNATVSNVSSPTLPNPPQPQPPQQEQPKQPMLVLDEEKYQAIKKDLISRIEDAIKENPEVKAKDLLEKYRPYFDLPMVDQIIKQTFVSLWKQI